MGKATVVKEEVKGGRVFRTMSDGTFQVEDRRNRVPGTQYGTYVLIEGEITEEKMAKAKAMLVDEVCDIIREIASKSKDFFIINDNLEDCVTVAHKFLLPTVEDEVELNATTLQIVK